MRRVVAVVLALMPIGCAAPSTGEARHVYRELLMGVEARLVVHAPDEASARRAARAAFDRIAELEDVLSDYRPDSELSRLNARAGGPPVVVSDDLFRVLERAVAISKATDGAFDMTVGPAVVLWREARRHGALPSIDDLERVRALVDWRAVHLDGRGDAQHRTARLARPGMRLDAGGIGKGFAADAALTVLREHGLDRCLVDFSGDIVAGAPPPGRRAWRVRVGESERTVHLANAAIASSGSRFQSVEIDGVRYSHIVDPRTGMGVTTPAVVTVMAPDATTADALASAVSVGGTRMLKRFPRAQVIVGR